MADKPNKGWLKEIAKKPAAPKPKEPFQYKKPISKVDKINSMAINSRTREHRSVTQDKITNLVAEQNQAKASHKGQK